MIVCADDYGLSRDVSEAILRLVDLQKISGLTCMVTSETSHLCLQKLRNIRGSVDIGLHFVLSEERPVIRLSSSSGLLASDGKFSAFSTLARRAVLGRLDPAAIENELRAQLKKFCDMAGAFPDFYDGHQHVHQLPSVREVFTKIVSEGSAKKRAYARTSLLRRNFFDHPVGSLKSMPGHLSISALGRQLQKRLRDAKIPYNPNLWGYHSYCERGMFRKALLSFLQARPEINDVFFTHPGKGASPNDPLARAREECFAFLMSAEYARALEKNQCRLNRFIFPSR